MHSGKSASYIDGKLPVFVFPASVTFYADDQSSHKQVLTLYNPYEFVLRFRVLCTAPKRYSVVDTGGKVKPGHCVDITIRHRNVHGTDVGACDKFRIYVFESGQTSAAGKKDILALLLPSKEQSDVEESFESLSTVAASPPDPTPAQALVQRNFRPDAVSSRPSWLVVLAAALCTAVLMLPTDGDTGHSRLPSYLSLSLQQKLIAAYVLGLLTMTLLRG